MWGSTNHGNTVSEVMNLQLMCRTCSTLLAHVNDIMSDSDLNAVHAWHSYTETLMIVGRRPLLNFRFSKKWSTNNSVNVIVCCLSISYASVSNKRGRKQCKSTRMKIETGKDEHCLLLASSFCFPSFFHYAMPTRSPVDSSHVARVREEQF